MAYIKNEWKGRQGTGLNKFAKSQETEDSVVLTNTPDSLTEEGTPFSAENMNHIEDGIEAAHGLIALEEQERHAAVSAEADARSQGEQAILEEIEALKNQINELSPEGFESMGLMAHPIGAIYETTQDTSPADLFGGTWTLFAAGKVLVGVDPSDTDFDEPLKSGGEKKHPLTTAELASHTHTGPSHTHTGPGHTHPITLWDGPGQDTSGPSAGNVQSGTKNVGKSGNTYYSSTTLAAGSLSANTGASGSGNTGSSGTQNTGSTGSGAAHNNMPPYTAVYRWERTA